MLPELLDRRPARALEPLRLDKKRAPRRKIFACKIWDINNTGLREMNIFLRAKDLYFSRALPELQDLINCVLELGAKPTAFLIPVFTH